MSRTNQTRAIKAKVIVGFSLVFMAFMAASYFSYVSFNKLLDAVEVIAQPNEKLLQIDSILVTITKTENTLQEYTVSKSDEKLKRYYQQVGLINQQLKHLQHDIEFKEDKALDSVISLLNARLINFTEFIDIKEKRDNFDFYNKTLGELEEQIQTNKNKNDTADSIVQQEEDEEKRSLLDRLFRKKDPVSEEIKESLPDADSVLNLNADSVKRILNNVRRRQAALQRNLNEQELAYLSNNSEVMDNIYQLIRQIKQEKQFNSEERTENAKATLEDSLFRIGIILAVVLFMTAIIVYLIFADITRSDYYRKKLQIAKSEAERLARVKEDFLANMSHEIRTPLTAILGFTKQLKETQLNNQQSEYINAVDNSSEHLLSLVNDILDFSKIEAGELKFERVPFDIIKVVQQVQTDLLPQAQKKSLSLSYTATGEKFRYLHGDSFRLKQVLYNLIYNAVKFTEEGNISVHCSLEPVNKHLTKACISVCDTGIGIPLKKLKEIFGAFSQTDVSNTRKYGGTGLGLSISKKLVEAQGGRIEVRSEEGKGSEFNVILTFDKATRQAVETEVTVQPKPADSFAGQRILVIDDDKLNTRLVEIILKKWGIEAVLVHSGKEGLRQYEQGAFDLILCDLQMPEMDGKAVVRKIRAAEKKSGNVMPFIAFTARILKDEWHQYKALGMDDYLLKPFSEEEMYYLFSKYFTKKAQQEATQTQTTLVSEPKSESSDISLKNVRMFTGNDDEAVLGYLESFSSVNKTNLENLEKTLASHSVKDVSFYAHKMFPGVQQLEVNALAANLRKLELLSTVNTSWDNQIEDLVQEVIKDARVMLIAVQQQMEELSHNMLKS